MVKSMTGFGRFEIADGVYGRNQIREPQIS